MQKPLSIRAFVLPHRFFCLLCVALFMAGPTLAIAQNIQVRNDLDFDLLDIAQLPGTAALGTNGFISYTGGLVGDGFGTAGEIGVSGKNGTTVDISCASEAIMSNGMDTITLSAVEMIVGTGTLPGWFGTVLCDGVGSTIIQLTTGNNNPDTALIGATLVTIGSESSGSYDTASAGGVPIAVQMVVP